MGTLAVKVGTVGEPRHDSVSAGGPPTGPVWHPILFKVGDRLHRKALAGRIGWGYSSPSCESKSLTGSFRSFLYLPQFDIMEPWPPGGAADSGQLLLFFLRLSSSSTVLQIRSEIAGQCPSTIGTLPPSFHFLKHQFCALLLCGLPFSPATPSTQARTEDLPQ